MKKDAFTLIELLIIIGLALFLAAVATPLFSQLLERARFQGFAARLEAHLAMAREVAQASESSVRLDLLPGPNFGYRIFVEKERDSWHELSRETALPKGVALKLPDVPLPHPSNGDVLVRALSSSHAPNIFFTPQGGSNATVVFSDGMKQAVCAVVSGRTGRFHVYLWQNQRSSWQALF